MWLRLSTECTTTSCFFRDVVCSFNTSTCSNAFMMTCSRGKQKWLCCLDARLRSTHVICSTSASRISCVGHHLWRCRAFWIEESKSPWTNNYRGVWATRFSTIAHLCLTESHSKTRVVNILPRQITSGTHILCNPPSCPLCISIIGMLKHPPDDQPSSVQAPSSPHSPLERLPSNLST